MPPHKRDIGMVFQNYALFPHMTVAGNVAYPLKLRGVARAEVDAPRRRARSTLVQLAGYGERQVRLSCPAASGSAWRWRAPSCSSRASC